MGAKVLESTEYCEGRPLVGRFRKRERARNVQASGQ